MNAKFGMLLGANLAVASMFMQGCKATKPNTPPPPSPAVDQQPPPSQPRTALQNDIQTTRYDAPKANDVAPVAPPPPKHVEVKPLPPPAPEFETYIVKKGDTLSQLCEKRGVRMSEALKLNPSLNANPNRILVGAKIKLPVAGAAPLPAPEPAAPGAKVGKLPPPPPPSGVKKADDKKTDVKPAPKGAAANVKAPATKKAAYKPYTGPTKEYVVKSGDQLGKIAQSFGISVRALKELNGFAGNDLKIGQKIKVPAEKVKAEEKKDAPAAADAAKKDAPAAAAAKDSKPAVDSAKKDDKPEADAAKKDETADADSDKKDAAAAPAPAAPAYETYTVKKGDDLVSIAINFGVSPSALMDLNDLKASDSVTEGQVLKIPAGAKAPASNQ